MYKKRIGNDLTVMVTMYARDESGRQPFDLSGRNITVFLQSEFGTRTMIENFTVAGEDNNVIMFEFEGRYQTDVCGYSVVVYENMNLDGMRCVDIVKAFELVPHSRDENVDNEGVVSVESEVNLETELVVGIKGDALTYDDLTEEDKADLLRDTYTKTEVDAMISRLSPRPDFNADFNLDFNAKYS